MGIRFGELVFEIGKGKIKLCGKPFAEVQIAGENKDSHLGAKMIHSSEGRRFVYMSHSERNGRMEIVQRSEKAEARTVLSKYADTNAVSIFTEIKNISNEEIVLEEASAFRLNGLGKLSETENIYFYRFTQSHHAECQPWRFSLAEAGLFDAGMPGQKRVFGCNVGSWSTKEELPQGIVEKSGRFLMFQIESNADWYYEISDDDGELYLWLGGGTYPFGGWCRRLRSGESYRTPTAAFCSGRDLNEVVGEMTKYRRRIAGKCAADKELPIIFNEYMHLSWDSPDEERTKLYARAAAKAGADYYVIDCGWHDEVPGGEVYPYVGKWRESKARFPHGVRAATEYIRSLGMKAGLWIEPEVVGCRCAEMIDFYGDECFLRRHGKKVCVMGRYFLDFRREKVRATMTETLRRMIEEYGADYIKLDYNEDAGAGTDEDADGAGEGLEQCAKAYLGWIAQLRERFPEVLFETCSSGGMRMDYETLKYFSVVSTSDQTDYRKYPYIAGNILAAVLPEQAAVWSYPVGIPGGPNGGFRATAEWTEKNISEEQVIMNMVNAMLGRIHLASDIRLLSAEKFALVEEGVKYAKTISEVKRRASAFFPLGFVHFGAQHAAAGIAVGKKIWLSVWNLGGKKRLRVPFGAGIKEAKIAYPQALPLSLRADGEELEIIFTEDFQARFLEIQTD